MVATPLLQATRVMAVATVIMSVVLIAVLPSSMPWLPDGFVTPIIAFEFAANADELRQMFAAPGSAQRSELIAAMDLGNQLDFLFMTLYSGFLALFACLLFRTRPQAALVFALAPAIWIGDVFETRALLQITDGLNSGATDFDELLAALHLWTWIKWFGLAFALALLGTSLWSERWGRRLVSCLLITTLPLALAAFIHRSVLNELFAGFVAIGFLLLAGLALFGRGLTDERPTRPSR